jgi:hypothetical protein
MDAIVLGQHTRSRRRDPGGPPAQVEGVRHRLVRTSRLRMHAAEAGRGEPVLLLHGWPQH